MVDVHVGGNQGLDRILGNSMARRSAADLPSPMFPHLGIDRNRTAGCVEHPSAIGTGHAVFRAVVEDVGVVHASNPYQSVNDDQPMK